MAGRGCTCGMTTVQWGTTVTANFREFFFFLRTPVNRASPSPKAKRFLHKRAGAP
jgi:hypothetical protein